MYRYTALVVVLALCNTLACSKPAQAPSATADDETKVQILVPLAELPPYTRFMDPKQFTFIEYPKSRLREDISDTITSFDQLKGKTSRHYTLKPNEPMYKNDLAEEDALRDGEVAYAIKIPSTGGGFIQKGNRIDICATLPADTIGNPIRTVYILEDIEVLDIASEKSKDSAFVSYRLLLRLTRPQALMLKHYQDTARIDVDKRKPGDPKSIKDAFTLSPDRTLSNAPSTPEQLVLNRWLGNWQTTYKQLKPEEKSGTAETLTTRVIGGQFVQEATAHSDKMFSRSTITYDAQKQTYRSWWFSSTGQTDESTGTWDADKKTMTWSSTTIGDAKTTVKQHFKDDDTIEFDVISKDRAGRVVFHMEGKSVRVKPAK
ncbi:MAG: DUF1579 family protein [Gemmatales bacterium]